MSPTLVFLAIKSWIPYLWGLILMIPRPVWIALGIVAAFLYYGNYVKKSTEARIHLEYKLKREAEVRRQQEVYKQVREAHKTRMQTFRKWRDQLDKDQEDALADLRKQLETKQPQTQPQGKATAPTKAPVCDCSIPGDFLRRLPNPR